MAESNILNFATIKYKQRMRPIATGSLLVPVFTMCTTASLSQRLSIALFSQYFPHTAAASTMGRSSFTVMGNPLFEETMGIEASEMQNRPHTPMSLKRQKSGLCQGLEASTTASSIGHSSRR